MITYMSSYVLASVCTMWTGLRCIHRCMCRQEHGSSQNSVHLLHKCQGMDLHICFSGMPCWMGSQSGPHTQAGMPHRDPQSIQECICMTRHCFSQYKVHLTHREKDCKDLVFVLALWVVLKRTIKHVHWFKKSNLRTARTSGGGWIPSPLPCINTY